MYIQRGAPQAAIGRQIPHHQSEGVDAPLCEGRCGQPRLDTFSVMGGRVSTMKRNGSKTKEGGETQLDLVGNNRSCTENAQLLATGSQ